MSADAPRPGAASLRDSWESEVQAAWLYRVLAEIETGDRKRLFERLAVDAIEQSRAWTRALKEAGEPSPGEYQPPFRVRLAAVMIRRFGPRALLPALAALKVRGLSVYRASPSGLLGMWAGGGREGGEAVGRRAAGRHLAAEESRHHRVRDAVTLRAAVFGANDGLVSNTALILGVGGATDDPMFVLVAGCAGLLAGALSMAAGEYVSMRSQIELYERQIALEEEELRLYPEDEAEELAMIFEARGMTPEAAKELGTRLIADPARALDVLTREELGLNPDDLGSPWAAAGSSLLAFSIGASVPLLPFLFSAGGGALLAAAALSVGALFAAGVGTSLFTGRSMLWSGARMVLIGGGAAAVTHGVGTALGVVLG